MAAPIKYFNLGWMILKPRFMMQKTLKLLYHKPGIIFWLNGKC